MSETLLSGSSITLFGRVVDDLSVDASRAAPPETPKGIRSALQVQLDKPEGNDPKFARIYGFSYGGVYYEILRPTLFLVHGDGVDGTKVEQPGPDTEDTPFYSKNLRAWAYDHAEQTIRLDYSAGRFEQVLLDMTADESFAQPMRTSVAGSRVAGSRVSGSRVSGSRVSGSRVSGSRVSGSRLDGSD
jgi:hypothetical protein